MFDAEWDLVLDAAKQTKNLTGVHELLDKWRRVAYSELKDPGTFDRVRAKAEQIMRAGGNPDAVPVADMMALIERRRGQ